MARVCNAGHGGQILLTDSTREELGELVEGIVLVSLGEVRLQGLPGPQTVYQVRSRGLVEEFPSLRVVDPT
jgi:class 3 adenylate cyclase